MTKEPKVQPWMAPSGWRRAVRVLLWGLPYDDCGFAAVGEVYGAPGFLEGCVVVDVGEGLVSGGVLEGGLVVSEENCVSSSST